MSDQLIAALPGTIFGLLGAIISAFAAIYARNVRREMRLGLIEPRLLAYRSLWKIMELASSSRCMEDPTKRITDGTNGVKQRLTKEDLKKIETDLRYWYYSAGEGGNGIFLSDEAAETYREAVKSVINAKPDDEQATRQVVDKLSTLRSRTKNAVAVYRRWEK